MDRIDLYVVRIGKDKEGGIMYRNARPCKYCLEIMRKYGVRRVFYTQDSPGDQLSYKCEKVSEMISTLCSYAVANVFS